MSLRESLNQLLEVEDQLQVVQLENKALRFQAEKQAEMIIALQDEVKFLRRFQALVSRSAKLLDDIPALKKEILSRKSLG